jgi:uncharacterized protein with NRDE domain
MCVVSIAWGAHSRWRLVVAGNRDEYHARASASVARWQDTQDIIAGRDLVSGGTWIGVSEAGRFAVVTNIRDPDGPDPTKASRGALVSDWLASGVLPNALDAFNPFNLLVADGQGLQYLANRPQAIREPLPSGIHGLSNAIANEHWPRKERLNGVLTEWLEGEADDLEILLEALSDKSLPDRDAHPIFIQSPVYGTRCSTVIAIDDDGKGQIMERRFDAGGLSSGEGRLKFIWNC